MQQSVLFSTDIQQTLREAISAVKHDRLFVLCDDVTAKLCWPMVSEFLPQPIVIGSTDQHKNLDTLAAVWTALQEGGATRHSLMVNLGGGMVTDLGGFAASTFKRGIHYINVPTTLLAQVDASVGGKTGINFGGLKNEVGVFSEADAVVIDTCFLRTLDTENLLSGYAEMLKHGLISNREHLSELLSLVRCDDIATNETLDRLLAESVGVKQRIVEQDPHEQNLRKALNLGHTFGHAFESFAMETDHPILHGYAVAFGMVCELYLSCVKCGFPTGIMRQVVQFIKEHYGTFAYTCDDYPTLFRLMQHDKKNEGDTINFTLLADVGVLRLNQTATRATIDEALDFLRDGL
ncbi:MAG: 3-dehydroquinate synthase [Bacteroidales bacterium]|nr:3-dehydroquinate synthase [Bacteroidales bacterium]